MYLLDVNVLLAAHRDDHPHHALVRPFFDDLIRGGADFGVPVSVWGSFLRIATHRRVFDVPTPMAEAFEFIRAVRSQTGHLPCEPGPRHLDLLADLCRDFEVVGDLVPDAILGAIAQEHGAEVATLDRDFARFSTVRTVRPEVG